MLLRRLAGRYCVQDMRKLLFSGRQTFACNRHHVNSKCALHFYTSMKSRQTLVCRSLYSGTVSASGYNTCDKGISRCYTTPAATASKKPRPVFRKLDGTVDTSCKEFQARLDGSKQLEEKHKQMVAVARSGGGPKAMERHVKANKKLFVQDRLRLLLDEYSDDTFLEIGTLAGFGMPYGDIPGASVVTGVGKINGIWCAITANDGTVKGGTVYPIGVKKQLRLQEIGLHNRLPCVYLVDSGGAFLPLQSEIFPDKEQGGKIFYNEARFSALKIPQVAIVGGSCTAGGAYVPAMCDEAVMVDKIGTIFLGGPPLVYAATGEKVSAENLGGATLHCKVSGVMDHFAATEEDAFETGREIVASLNEQGPVEYEGWEEPLYSVDELPGLVVDNPGSMKKVIARLIDGSQFHEFKSMYGPSLVTGMAYIQGHLVGIIGNDGPLTADAATKGAHFVELCCHRRIPLIFLQNLTSDASMPETEDGEAMGNVIRNRAKMMMAVACAQVPKMTVIIGDSFGPSNFAMCGRSFSPRFLFMWPSARIGIISPEEAGHAAAQMTGESNSSDKTDEMNKRYQRQVSALYSSGRLWDDGIILPQHTRQVLGMCLSIVSQRREDGYTDFGVFRM
ncbi:methylcrotonoyl-CoA carboxylase beta chain, mitochondrial-like [Patiria miniata]|uniref:methylcrotonoyl-CoA carboxylase n=1 Tax=Patiria miniata TaxID=46514 RepID=A0A914AZK4_PATMI|nr:methylcrotonoyl-CoA carboxylase beta chain, mitochondrial-like [Patiria miniata]